MDCQIVNPLHPLLMNVMESARESVRSQLEVTIQLLKHPTTRRSVQVRLVFGVPGPRAEGKRDRDQNRCPEDSRLNFARCRRLRRQEHARMQRSHWRQNPTRENSRRSKSARRSLALSLLSTRIRSSNQLHKLN